MLYSGARLTSETLRVCFVCLFNFFFGLGIQYRKYILGFKLSIKLQIVVQTYRRRAFVF